MKLWLNVSMQAAEAQAAIRAVSHPNRVAILRLVWDAELSSSDIASKFDLTWPAVSHNLKVLREAGFVRERRDGNRRLYVADREALAPYEPLLRQFWQAGLERLGRLAEQEASEDER